MSADGFALLKRSVDVTPNFRSGVKSAKGRARPDEPLAEWCEARIPGVCKGRAECRHHLLRRGRGGSDDASNTRDLCDLNGCHWFIHHNIEWAYEHGWLIRGAA